MVIGHAAAFRYFHPYSRTSADTHQSSLECSSPGELDTTTGPVTDQGKSYTFHVLRVAGSRRQAQARVMSGQARSGQARRRARSGKCVQAPNAGTTVRGCR